MLGAHHLQAQERIRGCLLVVGGTERARVVVLDVPRVVQREPADIALERVQVDRRVRLGFRLLGRHARRASRCAYADFVSGNRPNR